MNQDLLGPARTSRTGCELRCSSNCYFLYINTNHRFLIYFQYDDATATTTDNRRADPIVWAECQTTTVAELFVRSEHHWYYLIDLIRVDINWFALDKITRSAGDLTNKTVIEVGPGILQK